MMSPDLLARASKAYRRGYVDGYSRTVDQTSSYRWGTAESIDYADGYVAGHGDCHDDEMIAVELQDKVARRNGWK